MTTPQHKNPCSGGHEIYNFYRPFFSHHYYTITLYGPCPRVEKKNFKEINQIYTFYPQITSPWGGVWGNEIYNFFIFSSYICYVLNLVKISQVVSEMRMLMDDIGRTTTDANP